MQLFKALAAFYSALFYSECEHLRVAPPSMTPTGSKLSTSAFCPDCGYKIRALWSLCRCRTCGGKRQPKKGMDGKIRPLYRYCQHCGQTDFQLIKRDRIHVHELPYALLTKEIDYTEERKPSPKKPVTDNPFEAAYRQLDIVEGEVIHRSEQVYTQTGKFNRPLF